MSILHTMDRVQEEAEREASDYLKEYRPVVRSARAGFSDLVERRMPEAVGEGFHEYLRRRVNRGSRVMSLGPYVPWLLRDLLTVGEEVSERLTRVWMLAYSRALLIDDIIDESEVPRKKWWRWTHTLRCSLSDELDQLFSKEDARRFIGHIDGSFTEMIRSMSWERYTPVGGCVGITELPPSDGYWQGSKAAPWKAFAHMLVYRTEGRGLWECERRGLDSLSAGIQLIDDITDMQEDSRKGRISYPLALVHLEGVGVYDRGGQKVLSNEPTQGRSGCAANAIRQTYWLAGKHIQEGLKILRPLVDSPSARFFEKLLGESLEIGLKEGSRSGIAAEQGAEIRQWKKEESGCGEYGAYSKSIIRGPRAAN